MVVLDVLMEASVLVWLFYCPINNNKLFNQEPFTWQEIPN